MKENSTRMEERRKFIRDELRQHGKITLAKIQSWLDQHKQKYVSKTIRKDMEFIQFYESTRIVDRKDPENGELEWTDISRAVSLGFTREERMAFNADGKRDIARLLLAIIFGFDSFEFQRRSPFTEDVNINLKKDILDQIESFRERKTKDGKTMEKQITRLRGKLDAFWRYSQRSFFLDSGTTTEIFAREFLQYVPIPIYGNKKIAEKKDKKQEAFSADIEEMEENKEDVPVVNKVAHTHHLDSVRDGII